jgi:cytochrome P450
MVATARSTIFHSRVRRLLETDRGKRLFRIDGNTIGIADGGLARRVLAQRPTHDFERTMFKPTGGLPGSRERVMRALAQDIRAAIACPASAPGVRLDGVWPKVGHRVLRGMILAQDPWHARILLSTALGRSAAAIRSLEMVSSMSPWPLHRDGTSALACLVRDAADAQERRSAVTLYRKAASALDASMAALLTNALWLASPIDPDVPLRYVVLETLRLLPPLWMLSRKADSAYAALDENIREADDILVFPFLAHRNHDSWAQPDAFRPQRWIGIENPDLLTDYLPFGHGDDRCPARHLVLLLAERILADITTAGLAVDRRQLVAKVPLGPLLSVSRLKVIAGSAA